MYGESNNKKIYKEKERYHVLPWIMLLLVSLLITIPIGFIIKSCTDKDNNTHSDTKYPFIYENLLNILKSLNSDVSRLISIDNQSGSRDYKVSAINNNEDKIYLWGFNIKEEYSSSLFDYLVSSTITFGEQYDSYSLDYYDVVNYLDYDVGADTTYKLTYYVKSNSEQYYVYSSYLLASNKTVHVGTHINFTPPTNVEEKPTINVNQFKTYANNKAYSSIYLLNKYMLRLDNENRA